MTTTNEVKPYTDEEIEYLRRLRSWTSSFVVRFDRMIATLDERTRERDEARADAARDGGLEAMAREEADRMLASACDLRDALDSVAGALGVDTTTDADTEARACVAEVAALREEVARWHEAYREVCAAVGPHLGPPVGDKPLPRGVVEATQALAGIVVTLREEVDRLRSAVGGEQESAEQQRERAYAAERRAEEAEGHLRGLDAALVDRIDLYDRVASYFDADDDGPVYAAHRILSGGADAKRGEDTAALPSQEQPAAPVHANPPLAGGCACTATEQCAWHQMFGRFFAAPSTPKGEPADTAARPTPKEGRDGE